LVSCKKKKKVKYTLVQAPRLCTGHKPIGGVELELYSFLTTALEGVRGQRHAPAALYPRERPGTGGWVGPSDGLNSCGKSRPPPGFDPGLWLVVDVTNHVRRHMLCV